MNSALEAWHQQTMQMVERIDGVTPEEIITLIDLRNAVITQFQDWGTLIEEERELARQTLQMDGIITGRMEQLRQEATGELQKMQISRVQKEHYNNAYDIQEGFFFDKRK